jgi:SAM-dependent methyltransferase
MNETQGLKTDFLNQLEDNEIDFIDAGCGTGGSIDFCRKVFGFPNGIGFDMNQKKIAGAQSKGYPVYLQDILKINFPAKCVCFSSMMDFLEHLPGMRSAAEMIKVLGNASRDFLFIRHPNFDDTDYLRKYNLKLTWTDWTGHTNMMKISDFIIIFNQLGWMNYRIIPRRLINNSDHEAVLPLSAPKNLNKYSQLKGLEKQIFEFDKPVYSQYDIFVKLNEHMPNRQWDLITSKTSRF